MKLSHRILKSYLFLLISSHGAILDLATLRVLYPTTASEFGLVLRRSSATNPYINVQIAIK